MTLSYAARPGYALLPFSQIGTAGRLSEYCLAEPDLRRALGNPAAASAFVVWDYAIDAGIDGRPPPTVVAEVGAPNKQEQPRSLVAFCGSHGKAVIGQTSDIKALARTDQNGVLHILIISAAAHSR